MPFAIRRPHCGSRLTVKSDKIVGMQMPCPKCQEGFTVEQPAASTQREESDRLNRTPVLEAVIGGGATFLLLCGVGGCLLLSGCSRGASSSKSNEQASAEAKPESAAAEQQAKIAADQRKKAESLNNLKRIALAFHNYHDTYKTFPAAVQIGPKDVPHSWRITILPFLGESPLYDRYRQDEPWDSEHNKTLLAETPAVLRTPDDASNSSNTRYFGFTPTNPSDEPRDQASPVLAGTRATRMRDITDGTSNTVLVVESKLDVPWTQPTDLPFVPDQPLPVIGGIHTGGFCAALCDGSTTFIPDSYDRDLLVKLIDRRDGTLVKHPGEIERERAVAEEKKKLAASKKPADRRTASLANLKQIALAMHNYHDTYKALPAAVQIGPKEVPHSWRVTILPFIDQGNLYTRYHQDEPWDSPHNKTLLAEMPDVYRTPGAAPASTNSGYFGFTPTSATESGATSMPALAGSRCTRFRDITDGLSNCLMVVESKLEVPWTQPTDIPIDLGKSVPTMGGIHNGGFFAAMCDGSSLFFPDSFDRSMLLKIIQRADGASIELPTADY